MISPRILAPVAYAAVALGLAACNQTANYSAAERHSLIGYQVYQSTFGHRQLGRVSEAKNPLYPALAKRIGRLDYSYIDPATGGSVTSNCTATVLKGNYIITAAHCIPSGIQSAFFKLNFVDFGGEQNPFEVLTDPVDRDEGLDYAILRLKAPGSLAETLFEIRAAKAGEDLFVLGHPAGKPLHYSDEQCLAIPTREVEAHQIAHYCDTYEGHSGALVFARSDGAVVGIHTEGIDPRRAIDANVATSIVAIAAHSQLLSALTLPKDGSSQIASVAASGAFQIPGGYQPSAPESYTYRYVDGRWLNNRAPPIADSIQIATKYCADSIGYGCAAGHGNWSEVAPPKHDPRYLGVIICGKDRKNYQLTVHESNSFEYYPTNKPWDAMNSILQYQTITFGERLNSYQNRTDWGNALLDYVQRRCRLDGSREKG